MQRSQNYKASDTLFFIWPLYDYLAFAEILNKSKHSKTMNNTAVLSFLVSVMRSSYFINRLSIIWIRGQRMWGLDVVSLSLWLKCVTNGREYILCADYLFFINHQTHEKMSLISLTSLTINQYHNCIFGGISVFCLISFLFLFHSVDQYWWFSAFGWVRKLQLVTALLCGFYW